MAQTGSSMGSLLEDDRPAASPQGAGKPSAATSSKQLWMGVAGALGLVAALAILAFQVFGGPPSLADQSTRLTAIDMETGQVFEDFRLRIGDTFPLKNPSTGKNTLVPAERCFWTKDGKAKLKPTYILLNSYAGKDGDTICPDCGRKVVPRNPRPPDALMNEAIQRQK